MINKAASSVVGGYKIMASILSLSKEMIAKESESTENGSGTRNDLDRIQKKMVACAEAGHPEVCYLYVKFVNETYDAIMSEILGPKAESLQRVKSGEENSWMKFVNAGKFILIPTIALLGFLKF